MSKFTTISDEFWVVVEPLIPIRKRLSVNKYKRNAGGGRKSLNYRRVFEGIVYVLKTGCQWKALPKEFGASSSIHKYFCEWQKAKVFHKIWKKGLALYDDLQGISWQWQIADGSHTKAPIGIDAV